jgi:crossover junction endodeoxyribonuclease RuvC
LSVTIIGLDPGSHRLGYGIVRVERGGMSVSYVEAGVLEARAAAGKYERLGELGAMLSEVLDEHRPRSAAIEAGFVWGGRAGAKAKGGGQQGAITSAAARGVAAYLCVARGLGVAEYHAATVKLAAAGKGNADKELVGRMVQARLGLRRAPAPDAGDALAVAICHAQHARAELLVLERAADGVACGTFGTGNAA